MGTTGATSLEQFAVHISNTTVRSKGLLTTVSRRKQLGG